MVNDRNKEIKALTERDLANLLKISTGEGTEKEVQDFLLKSYAQMLHNDSTNGDWLALKEPAKSFGTLGQLTMDLKAVEGDKLSPENLEAIRKNISGDGTMKLDADASETMKTEQEGRIFLLIT